MIKDTDLPIIESALQEYVAFFPFDNIAVLLSWLNWLSQNDNQPVDEVFDSWQPNSESMISEFGGTNCVGATPFFLKEMAKKGIVLETVISPSNRLPEGCTFTEVPFQHLGLIAETDEGLKYFVEPGLGLVKPIPTNARSIEIADRYYEATMADDRGELCVIKPDGAKITYDFIYMNDFPTQDVEELIQKPLLRATTFFKIDVFSRTGEKRAALKIDFYQEKISFLLHDSTYAYTFDEVNEMIASDEFRALAQAIDHLSFNDLSQRIVRCVSAKEDVVAMWLDGLQKQYYLDNPEKLSPYETDWATLEQRGYKGGGVVVVLVNEQDQVMMYEVPEGKSKPYINRYAGQHNLFVETADKTKPEGTVADLENLQQNLQRAFEEELGLAVPEVVEYREVDYMPGIRARCVICRVDSATVALVNQHADARNREIGYQEIGPSQWVPIDDVHQKWLEPNAASILTKLINSEVLQGKREKSILIGM